MRSMHTRPPLGFRNGHVNTVLGNNGPRKWLVARRARPLNERGEAVILECRDGVRLHGIYNPAPSSPKGLAILIHGWEGCYTSTYLQSAAVRLQNEGYSVFRLHMRDHGPSHHLNKDPFLAIRLDEILDGIEQIVARFPHHRVMLAGFSLGANLSVRVAANASRRAIKLDQVVAVSPPIDPEAAAYAIQSYPVYNRYFIGKWQRSFAKKVDLFEDHLQHKDLLRHRDILEMHEDFIPRFSDHDSAASYFRAYALNARTLTQMDAPCHVIMVEDDPIIPVATSEQLPKLDHLTLEVVPYGGHCGFVKNYRLDSWVDDRLVALFA